MSYNRRVPVLAEMETGTSRRGFLRGGAAFGLAAAAWPLTNGIAQAAVPKRGGASCGWRPVMATRPTATTPRPSSAASCRHSASPDTTV